MYREAMRVAATLGDVTETLASGVRSSEVILVDDGSDDATVEVASRWVTEAPRGSLLRVALLRHEQNRGKGAAVRTGLGAARGEWRLMMDADNAARVSEVEKLMARAGPGVALVCGSRNAEDSRVTARAFRKVSGGVFRLALAGLGLNLIRDTQCGFKLYSRGAAELAVEQGWEDRFAFDLEHLMLARRAGSIIEVGIAWEHRDGGTVNPVTDGLKMLREAVRIRWRFLSEKPSVEIEVKPVPVRKPAAQSAQTPGSRG
jgi:dolichyl-phosphate beta-glucosyltransferase